MKINKILKDKKMKAKDLSQLTGIGYSTVQKYACGQRKPTVENAKKIAEVLNIDWWNLF